MAGVRVARALAGAPSAAFMTALEKQEQIVRLVITEAGFGGDDAGIAGSPFEVGAKLEWQRFLTSLHAGAHGNA